MTMKCMVRSALAVALATMAIVAALTVEFARRGEAALVESDAAFNRGDVESAAVHARRAATAYVPGARHVTLAYERLHAIARGAEATGDPQVARLAWGHVRAAVLQTDYPGNASEPLRRQADASLARLAAESSSDVTVLSAVPLRKGGAAMGTIVLVLALMLLVLLVRSNQSSPTRA
jgi:hypothetical protein